jgi:hypothetical protein
LKFSGVAQNVFTAVRAVVDGHISDVVPGAMQKFASVHDNLRSQNPEDWANAVHSCRRILEELADALFPTRPDRKMEAGKTIKLGQVNYINRLVCFADENSKSERFAELVGSHLGFLGIALMPFSGHRRRDRTPSSRGRRPTVTSSTLTCSSGTSSAFADLR